MASEMKGIDMKTPLSLLGLDQASMEATVKSFGKATQNRRAARKFARNKDAIQNLLRGIKEKPKFTKMVEYSVECFKNLAVDEVSIEEMIDEGVLDVFLDVLKLNPYNEKIQQQINAALLAFCKNDHLAKLVAEKFGANSLVFSLKKHLEPVTLAGSAAAMAAMMKFEGNIDMVVKSGAIPALRHAAKTSNNDPEVLTAIVACYEKIASKPQYAKELMDNGCVEDIMVAMQTCPGNIALMKSCVAALASLACIPEYIEKLKAMGILDLLVAILETHPDQKALLRSGAAALKYLSGKADVMLILAMAPGLNPETAAALSKLSSLLLVDGNVDLVVASQGINWVMAALNCALGQDGELAAKILVSGCRALSRLACDENKIYQILQQGGAKMLLSVIQKHINDANVCAEALTAIAKMFTRKENAAYFIQMGAIVAAQTILQQHMNNPKAARAVVEFFAALAVFPESVPAMVQQGALKSICDVLMQHCKDEDIATAGILALGRCALSAEYMQAISAAGGNAAIYALLQAHKNNADLSKNGLILLETACQLPENAEALKKMGISELVLEIMNIHKDNEEIRAICTRALDAISGASQDPHAPLKLAVTTLNSAATSLSIATAEKALEAIRAVANLALVDSNIELLVQQGAPKSLLTAFLSAAKLPASETRTAILSSAAEAILRLCMKSKEAQLAIINSGGLRQLMSIAIAEKDNEQLAEIVAELALILASNPDNIERLLAAGAHVDLVILAKTHPLSEKLLADVVRALAKLAINPQAISDIIKAGGAEIVAESILANMNDVEALKDTLNLLNQLAIDEAAIQALINAGCVDALLEAIRTHHNNPEILQLCFSALCRLLISEEVAREIGEKDGLTLGCKAMRTHYQHEGLCEIDMILMDSLASLPENAKKLLNPELGTIDLIKWVSNAFSNNAALQEAYQRLYETLSAIIEAEAEAKRKAELTLTLEDLGGDKCDVILSKIKNKQMSKADMKDFLTKFSSSLREAGSAQVMNNQALLHDLAQIMAQNRDDCELFYASATAFLDLVDQYGDDFGKLLESNPDLLAAFSDCLNSHHLFQTPMSLEDLTRAVGALSKLKLSPAILQELMKGNTMNSLYKMLIQSDDPVLLAQAARLLGKLSNNPQAAGILSQLVNLRDLISAIRRNMNNAEFLRYAVYLLANLAVNDELKNQIGIEGGIQCILQIIETHITNTNLIDNCCYALSNLSFGNDINVSFIVACKGIPLMLQCMATHNRAVDLLESAVCVLCNLCPNNDNNKDLIIKAGGAQAIVDVVLNNFNELDLLITCYRTIGNLANNTRNISAIIKAGAVQAVVAGMTVHGEELDIIDISIRVLTNLAMDLSEENQNILAAEGAVQAVVEVSIQHIANVDIEISAFNCLAYLARQVSNATMIIKQGGVESSIRALKAHTNDANLVEKVVRLHNAFGYCQNEIEMVLNAGAAEALLLALRSFPAHRPVLTPALSAVSLFSFNESCAARMAQDGTIQAVLLLLTNQIRDPITCSECFSALGSLSRYEHNAVSMSELAMQQYSLALATHPNDARVATFAFAFLANLAMYASATEAAPNTPVIRVTLEALRRFKGQSDVVLRGLLALENLAYGPEDVKEHMKAEGIMTHLEEIPAEHAVRDDIRRACKQVIDALSVKKTNIDITPMKLVRPSAMNKPSAREIFGDTEVKVDVIDELPQNVKNFLLAGQLLTKHSMTAPPRPRHVYVTQDLKWIVWKKPSEPLHEDNKMKVSRIRTVEGGRATPQLQRKTMLGKFLAKEECAFAILGRDRTVDLEAPTEDDCNKWITNIELLIAYHKALKNKATQFE